MNDLDKAICKMIADYLDKAIDAIEHLTPDGAHELAEAISDRGLPHEGDLQALALNVKRLSKTSERNLPREKPSRPN